MTGADPVARGDHHDVPPLVHALPSSGRRGEHRQAAAALVLAAGSAQRFGTTKQLIEVDGLPLVAHAVAAAHAAGVAEVVVVVGHQAQPVAAAARRGGTISVVTNPAYATGQASSLVAGVDHLTAGEAGAAVVLLADEPQVPAAAIRAVVDAVVTAQAARARYDDGPGHPVAFARATWPQLRQLTGDAGARDLLSQLDLVDVPVPGPRPHDIDTPADLARLVGAQDDTSQPPQ